MAGTVHPMMSGFREGLTGYCGTISSDHAYIHQGKSRVLCHTTASLAAAAVEKLAFTTPAASTGIYIHWRPSMISSSANAARYQLYEDTDYANGTVAAAQDANRNTKNGPAMLVYTAATAGLAGRILVSAEAGGNFGNQPAGDAIEVLSSDAADTTQTVTIYGTKTGTTTSVVSETVALNGTTAVATTTTTWQNILGIELSASCAGTVTIREASADQTVTTISTGNLSAGILAMDYTDARCKVLIQKASGAATTPVGIIGIGYDGNALSTVNALNGTSDVACGTTPFKTISKVLGGAVASGTAVTVTRPEVILDQVSVGTGGASNRSGGASAADSERVLEPGTKYVVAITNIGATTATTVDVTLAWYEESAGY